MRRQSELRSVSREHPAKTEYRNELLPTSSEFGSIMSALGSMERMLEETVRRPLWAPVKDIFRDFGTFRESYFHPTVDVFEQGGDVVVKCELPGMKREDISVSFSDDYTLVISGERKSVENIERSDYLSRECSYGSFKRTLSLPEGCDHEKAKASYHDGILEIRIPKSAEVGKSWSVPIE